MDTTALATRLIRNFREVELEHFIREPRYDTQSARLAPGTVARKLSASVDTLAPGRIACPYHFHHAQEEMFIVLEGAGTLRVAGQLLPLKPGDVVFIPPGPDYPHQIINSSEAPLLYLSIGTTDSPEICEYPDSGKYLATTSDGSGGVFDALGRTAANLDYWDGES